MAAAGHRHQLPGVGRAPCESCLRRTWLLAALGGHIDCHRDRVEDLLALDDEQLLAAVGGKRRETIAAARRQFDHQQALRALHRAGLQAICRCDDRYPPGLRRLGNPPAVLHVAGSLDAVAAVGNGDAVAIVGCRNASSYGIDVARSLGRSLAAAGLMVISGLALGIDCAAHEGALAGGGLTIAVMPGSAHRPYPVSAAHLYRRIALPRQQVGGGAQPGSPAGAAVSELPPGVGVRRWMFPARNRIIAALARMTVVVEGGASSGALLTARTARSLRLQVGAVPGRITAPQAAAPHLLLSAGAKLIRGPEDVLEALFGAGAAAFAPDSRPALDEELEALLALVAAGEDTLDALARAGMSAERTLEGLAELELAGYIHRGSGGRFAVLS